MQPEQVAEMPPLLRVRQLAVDDQVGRLDEGRVLRQLLDRVAAVTEDAGVAVDEGDAAGARPGVAEAVVVRDVPRLARRLRTSIAFSPSEPTIVGRTCSLPSSLRTASLAMGRK
jgi:hypothetical protein